MSADLPPRAARELPPHEAQRELARLRRRRAERAERAADAVPRAAAVVAEAEDAVERQARLAQGATEQADRADRSRREAAERSWARTASAARSIADGYTRTPAAASWATLETWTAPLGEGPPPDAVRIGTIEVPDLDRRPGGAFPVLVGGLGRGHLQVVAPDAARGKAVAVLEAAMLRMIGSAPAGAVRFQVFDPVGLGATLGALARFDRARVGRGMPIGNTQDLRAALDRLADHATTVSAEHLQGRYPSLRTFLEQPDAPRVPFEILVLLDGSQGLDDEATDRITRLAAQGPSRGISLLVHEPAGGALLDLGSDATAVHLDARGRARIPSLGLDGVTLDDAPPPALVDLLAARTPSAPAPLEFRQLADGPRSTYRSAATIGAPIGRGDGGIVELELGDDPPHGLLAGSSGAGKSNLLRVIVYGLARRYPASELRLYLLDFKEGVEFQEFAATPADPSFLPQAAVVSVNSSREFGVEVLRHLSRVVAERYRTFNATPGVSKLEALRARRPDAELPRMLVIIDEFHRLFDHDDALGAAAIEALLDIARQGRAAGVHFLLATQSIGDVGVSTGAGVKLEGVFRNAGLRVGMRLDDQGSREIFSSQTNTAAGKIHEPGVAIVNAQTGAEAHNVRTRVAYLSEEVAAHERREGLSQAVGARRPPRVFDGSRGADATGNQMLRAAVRGRRPNAATWLTWIAESLRIDGDDPRSAHGTPLELGRDADRHLAVVGSGMRTAFALLQWATVGLAVTTEGPELLLVDATTDEDVGAHGLPPGLVDATAMVARGRGASVEVIRRDEAAAVVAAMSTLADGDPDRAKAAVLFGADRLGGLGEPLDPDAEEWGAPSVRDRLVELLRTGPRRRFHVLGSWANAHAFEELADAHPLLGMRAYLRMPELELRRLTGGDHVGADGTLALWHDLGRGGGVQTIHAYEPFGVKDVPKWLA